MKKLYYFLFAILIIVLGYYVFIKTDLFVPKQEEVENSDQLFLEVLWELGKTEKSQDTILFSFYEPEFGNIVGCGNPDEVPQPTPTPYELKILQIKKYIEHPYIIDEGKLTGRFIDKAVGFQCNTIMLGRLRRFIDSYCGTEYIFEYQNTVFCLEDDRKKRAFFCWLRFDSIKEKEVTIQLYGYTHLKLKMILENGKWRRKDL